MWVNLNTSVYIKLDFSSVPKSFEDLVNDYLDYC